MPGLCARPGQSCGCMGLVSWWGFGCVDFLCFAWFGCWMPLGCALVLAGMVLCFVLELPFVTHHSRSHSILQTRPPKKSSYSSTSILAEPNYQALCPNQHTPMQYRLKLYTVVPNLHNLALTSLLQRYNLPRTELFSTSSSFVSSKLVLFSGFLAHFCSRAILRMASWDIWLAASHSLCRLYTRRPAG
jgi:hypothetical protein